MLHCDWYLVACHVCRTFECFRRACSVIHHSKSQHQSKGCKSGPEVLENANGLQTNLYVYNFHCCFFAQLVFVIILSRQAAMLNYTLGSKKGANGLVIFANICNSLPKVMMVVLSVMSMWSLATTKGSLHPKAPMRTESAKRPMPSRPL